MSLLDLLLPPACGSCGRFGAVLCDTCRAAFRRASAPADRFVAADPGIVVGDALEVALAAFVFEGPLRRALSRLKYGGAARLAVPLADAAAPLLQALTDIAGTGTLVPVPVHAERMRVRGYNQAGILAAALAARSRIPHTAALERLRPTTQQHRLDRAGRLRNLRDAFGPAAGARAPPVAILVDDILTTSATLEACAAVLRAAGSQRVLGFAIAREV